MALSSRKTLPKKSKRAKTQAQLKKELDAIFSIYVRRSAADYRGYAQCVTCGVVKPWQELQCGHYVSRSALATRFDERNCHPQCMRCNVFLNGNSVKYTLYLQAKYGAKIVEELDNLSKKQTLKYPYESEIARYKALVQNLEN